MNALYSLYDALVSINVPNDRARAVIDAMERDMTTVLATKSDLALLESRLDGRFTQLESRIDGRFAQFESRFAQFESRFAQLEAATDNRFAQLESKLELLRSSMTVRLGSMLIAGFGLLFAALKLTG
jgi:hypothetical protein